MYNERFLAQTKPYGSRKGANHLRRSACMSFIVLAGMSMKAVLLHLRVHKGGSIDISRGIENAID